MSTSVAHLNTKVASALTTEEQYERAIHLLESCLPHPEDKKSRASTLHHPQRHSVVVANHLKQFISDEIKEGTLTSSPP